MPELWSLTASEIARDVRSRTVSAVEVAQAALGRIDRVNPAVNAVVDHRPDETLAAAQRVDDAIGRGQDPGPLAGVPVTIKVNVDQRGFATTNGLTSLRENVAAHNSPVVDSLLAAGAVIVGRTNTPAFSYRWFTSNRLHGATKNPHDGRLTPGGSSGGAAAAVATGICAIGHGTDIAGSIRYPAYACGVHGLRPSTGRVAAYNASLPEREIGPQLMAVSGPLARSVADLRLALAALARPDPRDPFWIPAPLEGPAAPRRVALCVTPGGMAPSEPVARAVLKAGEQLRDAGWRVDELDDLPPLVETAELQVMFWLGDGYAAKLAAAEREGDEGALAVLRGHQRFGGGVDVAALSAGLTRRATLMREWSLFFERHPVVLAPVSAELPFEDQLDRRDAASFARVWRAQTLQIAIPFLGLPGLTVTTGFEGRTPVGVQLIAGRFREDLCLSAGAAIEAANPPIEAIDPERAVRRTHT